MKLFINLCAAEALKQTLRPCGANYVQAKWRVAGLTTTFIRRLTSRHFSTALCTSRRTAWPSGDIRFYHRSENRLAIPPPPRKKRQPTGSPIGWNTVIFTVTFGTIFVIYLKWVKYRKEKAIDASVVKSYGKPSLGGDFELVTADGKLMSNKDFVGKWILIYFGFTHCPDICPEELEKMGNVVDIVNRTKMVPDLQPVFISIDPERDTPLAVKQYLSDFHPTLIGLTGSREQIDTASRAFRVYYSAGPKDGESDYLVDHTVIMYLIDDGGEFCEYYGQTKSAGEIASNILGKMAVKRKEKESD